MSSFLPALPHARRGADGSLVFDAVTLRWATDLATGVPPEGPVLHDPSVLISSGLAMAGPAGAAPELVPEVAELLARVGLAEQSVQLHHYEGGQERRASLLDGPQGPALTEHGRDGTCTVHPVARGDRLAVVAEFVGFERATPPRRSAHGGPAAHAVERFHSCLTRGDSSAASEVLHETTRWSRGELELLLDLVEGRCHSWRVVHRDRTLTVVDGARRGLWSSEARAGEPTHHGFVATSGAAVERALVALVEPDEPAVQVA